MTLNLARRPFANLRPLRRLAVGLWALGGVAALASAWLFAVYLSGSAEKRAELTRLEESAEDESQRIVNLEEQLGRFDLESLNGEVDYLNDRIAERTFAWSDLFDDLAQVLPWNVRVLSLSPLSIAPGRRAAAQSAAPGKSFALRLMGSARDGEALLTFVDRLFAHPAFAEPNLEQERREGGEELVFALTVTYRPDAVASPAQIAPSASSPAPAQPAAAEVASAAAPSPAQGAVAAGDAPSPSPPVGSQPAESGAAAPVPPQRPIGQATPLAETPAPPGWQGVVAGSATTARPPEPVPAEAPIPFGVPLPLSPDKSSPVGIR